MTAAPSACTIHSGWLFLATLGGLVWSGILIGLQPSPSDVQWARLLLLLGPLVLVPLGIRLWQQITATDRMWYVSLIRGLQLPTALLLAASQWLEQGWLAASLASGWVITTSLIAWIGLCDVWQNRRGPVYRLSIDAGLIYLAVGGAWAMADRLGWRPLNFEPVIVMLTAIHFHFAGFVLPIVTGLTAQRLGSKTAVAACLGVVAGMPLVAIGITGTKLDFPPVLESLAAIWMAIAGTLSACTLFYAAWTHRRNKLVRAIWTVAAISLSGSMILAALYGLRHYLPLTWLDIPLMRVTHGTANALGFALLAILGWTLEARHFALPLATLKHSRHRQPLGA